ncbi:MAG TPA: hypothetical protein P5309_10080 [Syntrophomonadaceae bacterium]|jgi:hypothetical protein|nr:hypothetical protein [Syntrophomonadaceae bacterium]
MVIVVGKWKEKLIRVAALIVVVVLFAAALPTVAGVFYEKVPVFSGWMQDEHPTGNPMRVEQPQDVPGTEFSDRVDQFVIKLQNFYLQEQE